MKIDSVALKNIINSHNLSHSELADEMNVSVSAVSRWIYNGRISHKNFRWLCKRFNVSSQYLSEGWDDEHQKKNYPDITEQIEREQFISSHKKFFYAVADAMILFLKEHDTHE